MLAYKQIKLKCFLTRLIIGIGIIICSIGVGIAMLTEFRNAYQSESLYAYVAALVIIILLFIIGIWLLYQAFHFERAIFRHHIQISDRISDHINSHHCCSVGNLIVTNQIVFIYQADLRKMCTVIDLKDIIACFEFPIYGTVAKPTMYSIVLFDRWFKQYRIVFSPKDAEAAHAARKVICKQIPWIYYADSDNFRTMMMTAAGRRQLLTSFEKKKYEDHTSDNTDFEAEEVLIKLENEAKEKLNFHNLLDDFKDRQTKKEKENMKKAN